jgi:hypothetical protein
MKSEPMDLQIIESEIGTLADLDLAALRKRWRDHYRCAPPVHMSRQVLIQAIAYGLQKKAFGGLSRSAAMKLNKAAKGPGKSNDPSSRRADIRHRIKPGTRFMREWNGRSYEVIAIDNGKFLYQGEPYTSLSRIARQITGTQWSGPVFFGLSPKKAI